MRPPVTGATRSSVLERHRQNPVPFVLLCAGAALMVAAGILLYSGREEDYVFWPGLACILTANVLLAVKEHRRKRAVRAGT